VIPYDFDGLVGFNHPRYLRPVLDYALAARSIRIEVVGYRGAALLSDGSTMTEEDGIGRRRAEQVAMLLKSTELQSPDIQFSVRWQDAPSAVDGEDDYKTRQVLVTVYPR
jgi:osmotically-inducible protein OsmY